MNQIFQIFNIIVNSIEFFFYCYVNSILLIKLVTVFVGVKQLYKYQHLWFVY